MGISKTACTFKASDGVLEFIDAIRYSKRPVPSRSQMIDESLRLIIALVNSQDTLTTQGVQVVHCFFGNDDGAIRFSDQRDFRFAS